MELDERSHILDHEKNPTLAQQSGSTTNRKVTESQNSMELKHFPDTPESSKSDLNQLVNPQDDLEKNKVRSSMPMASFNFINSIIGSGIIGVPYALKEAGFGLGLILILLVTIITDQSLVLLIHAGELSNTNTYQDVMRAAFGRPGFILLTFTQFMYPLIAMISYNVIIGDTITKIVIRVGGAHLAETIIGRREFVICATTLIVTLPLSLYRNIARLSKMSLVSIAFVLFIMAVMIARGITMKFALCAIIGVIFIMAVVLTRVATLHIPHTDDAWQFANIGVTKSIGILAFAYLCHHNSFLIYSSLIDANEKRWAMVTHASVLFSMICISMMGIAGYATFTGYVQGDVLENYCYHDDLANAARVFFAFTIMLTYPIECFVTREVVENAVFAFQQPPPLWRHLVVTITIVVITGAISMTTDCLGIVLELNGIINATPLAFIFPALCVLKLQNEKILSVKNIPKLLICLFGVLVAISGLAMVILELVHGIHCSHGVEMPYCREGSNVTIVTEAVADVSEGLPSTTSVGV